MPDDKLSLPHALRSLLTTLSSGGERSLWCRGSGGGGLKRENTFKRPANYLSIYQISQSLDNNFCIPVKKKGGGVWFRAKYARLFSLFLIYIFIYFLKHRHFLNITERACNYRQTSSGDRWACPLRAQSVTTAEQSMHSCRPRGEF